MTEPDYEAITADREAERDEAAMHRMDLDYGRVEDWRVKEQGRIERMTNNQTAPFPSELSQLVDGLVYKPHWVFTLERLDRGQGSAGLTLIIRITTPDSYNHSILKTVLHYFPVPPAAYDVRSWQHWLLEQVLLVERHEACEFFTIDGVKPYAPSHGPGSDPYLIREIGTETDVRTSFRGVVSDA